MQTNINQIFKQVFDEDIGQDKRLGVTKLPLIELEAETPKEIELRLQPSLNMLKIKEKKDRGTITIKVRVQRHKYCFRTLLVLICALHIYSPLVYLFCLIQLLVFYPIHDNCVKLIFLESLEILNLICLIIRSF